MDGFNLELLRVISWIALLLLFLLTTFQQVLEVLHGTNNISFGVLKEDKCAHGGNLKLGHHDLSSVGLDRGHRIIDRFHTQRALKSKHRLSFDDLSTPLKCSLHGMLFIAGFDKKEVWRASCGKVPAEGFLIEAAGAVHVVGMNSKVLKVICHSLQPFG